MVGSAVLTIGQVSDFEYPPEVIVLRYVVFLHVVNASSSLNRLFFNKLLIYSIQIDL